MSTSDERVLRTLRAQAWARCKSEIEAVLTTYWGDEEKFSSFEKLSKRFMKEVEDDGCAE